MLICANTGLHSARPNDLRIPMIQGPAVFKEAGFEAVDINFCGTIYDEPQRHEPILDNDDWQRDLGAVVSAYRQAGLPIRVSHLPYFNYALPDAEKLARNDQMMYRAIEASVFAGAKYAVIHPHRDAGGNTQIKGTIEKLSAYNEAAQKIGLTLCVENMFATTAEQLCQIVDALDCGACWDVGHANLRGHEQYPSITMLGKRLKTVHLHDNDGKGDQHLPPYMGTIDWPGIVHALRDAGYEGDFNFEVGAARLPMSARMDYLRYIVHTARALIG